MRKQQLLKVLKHYTKKQLVSMVYTLDYDYWYTCELLEYSPQERYLDYATNHAHAVATANVNIDELEKCSKQYLYNYLIDTINGLYQLENEY